MKEKLIQAFGGLADSTVAAAPKVAVGILLVVAALLIAKIIESVLRYTLAKVRFDSLLGGSAWTERCSGSAYARS